MLTELACNTKLVSKYKVTTKTHKSKLLQCNKSKNRYGKCSSEYTIISLECSCITIIPNSLLLKDSDKNSKSNSTYLIHTQKYKISLIKALTHGNKSSTTTILILTHQHSLNPHKLITQQHLAALNNK